MLSPEAAAPSTLAAGLCAVMGLIGSRSAHSGSAEPGAAAAAWPCERNIAKAQRVLLVQSRVLKSCVDTAPALPPRVKVTMMLEFFRLLYHLKNKL